MRVIAGQYRGMRLSAPEGRDTRPTTDRVREGLMSSLYSARGGFEGARVLDAFAGSGALAIESLSRGAAFALLCDCDRRAIRVIEANLAQCHIGKDKARILHADMFTWNPSSATQQFDLVFLDPPYAVPTEDVARLVTKLDDANLLTDDVIICYEHAASRDVDAICAWSGLQYAHIAQKKYGAIAFDIRGGRIS